MKQTFEKSVRTTVLIYYSTKQVTKPVNLENLFKKPEPNQQYCILDNHFEKLPWKKINQQHFFLLMNYVHVMYSSMIIDIFEVHLNPVTYIYIQYI